nr:glycosyltransferase family 2 protein [Sphingomonas jinjuensis]
MLVEVLLGAVPPRRRGMVPAPAHPVRIVVLVPAHDEAAGIAAIVAPLADEVDLLVVADNCSDDTAAVARGAGARVVERADPVNRGKGFALARGRDELAADPPDCVVVLDADTAIDAEGVRRLAADAVARGRPVQGCYLLEPRSDASVATRFSAAAFLVKNLVRQLGTRRLGAPALLVGSGMAFPWTQFATLPLATGHVAEDMMLGVVSAIDGHAPRFAADVLIVGATSSDTGTVTQRRRWESGAQATAREFAPKLVRAAFARRRPGLLWLALDLCVPPLILLLLLDSLLTALLMVAALFGASPGPFILLGILTTALIVTVPLSILLHGRADLVSGWREIPRYALWKAKLSLGVLARRERNWIRTERD